MKFYLSSYEIGNQGNDLSSMLKNTNKKIGYICNALDFPKPNIAKRNARIKNDCKNLEKIEAIPEILNLQDYFHQPKKLEKKLSELAGVFVSGGNTFILRQVFYLSGFDRWLQKNISTDFIYAGYSAGCCILSKNLENLQIVDDSTLFPYKEITKPIWEGIGILKYSFLPHYDSDHHESADIDKEIEYAIENKIPFKALRDGEVLVFEKNELEQNNVMRQKKKNFAFIDSANLHHAFLEKNLKINYKRFFRFLTDKYNIDVAFIFIGYIESQKKYYEYLKRSGFTLIFKPTLKQKGVIKGNCDGELILHAITKISEYNKALIISGDGDFYCLHEYLLSKNKLLKIILPHKKKYSSLLRFFAQYFVFLEDFSQKFSTKKVSISSGTKSLGSSLS